MRFTKTILVAAIGACTLAAGQARDPLDELFARGRASLATIQTIRASFTETSVSPLLVRPIVATGSITATREPLHIVMAYATPERRTVTIDTKTLVVIGADGRHEEVDIARTQARIRKYFVDAPAADLRRSFDLTLRQDATGPGADHLIMVAKRKQIEAGLSRLDLWIDPSRLLLTRLRMAFPSGDTKTLDLTDIRVDRTTGPARVPPSRPEARHGGHTVRLRPGGAAEPPRG